MITKAARAPTVAELAWLNPPVAPPKTVAAAGALMAVPTALTLAFRAFRPLEIGVLWGALTSALSVYALWSARG